MINFSKNEKINKNIKKVLMVIILLAVQFVMFEINGVSYTYAATTCGTCGAELVSSTQKCSKNYCYECSAHKKLIGTHWVHLKCHNCWGLIDDTGVCPMKCAICPECGEDAIYDGRTGELRCTVNYCSKCREHYAETVLGTFADPACHSSTCNGRTISNNTPWYGYCDVHCHRCGGAYDVNGKCGNGHEAWWRCSNCKGANTKGYNEYCPVCEVWYGYAACDLGSTKCKGSTKTHSCCYVTDSGHRFTADCYCGKEDVKCSVCGKVKSHEVSKPTLSQTSYTYNGSARTPISNGTYYTVSNNSATNAGSYTTTVEVKDASIHKFTGGVKSFTLTWKINPKSISVVWDSTDKFAYSGSPQSPSASASTGVTGETATITTTKKTEAGNHTSTASISKITGGNGRVANYVLTNTTKNYTIYKAPTVPPTIKYIDEGGNDITFIDDNIGPYDISTYPNIAYVQDSVTGKKVRAWYNQNIRIQVSGSTLNNTPGGVGYMYHFDVTPNDTNVSESYQNYSAAISVNLLGETVPYQQYKYGSITGTNKFHAENGVNRIYFKSYNTGYHVSGTESSEVNRYITKIEKTKPTMEISSNKTWSKSQTATIRLADVGGSHLLEKTYTLQYSWTQSKDTPSVYSHSKKINVANGVDVATTEITKNTGYGVWYLHVKLTEKLEDNATNFIDDEDLIMCGEFWLDNLAPVISIPEAHPFVVLDKNDAYSIEFEVHDDGLAGIEASEFTAKDIEILLQPDNVESAANKVLTRIESITSEGSNLVRHRYRLDLTNVAETGYYNIRISEGKLADKVGNSNLTKIFTTDITGITGDNDLPIIALNGPIKVESITEGKNLSGVIDERYINKEYEISIPIEATDDGILDILDGLQTTDLTTFVGDTLVEPTVNITLDSEGEIEDSITHVKTFKKQYTLTYSGIRNDGYLVAEFNNTAISDATENKNVTTSLRPYFTVDETKYFTYVDNTTPRITLLNADVLQTINKNSEIVLNLKLIDSGAGIRGTGPSTFESSDIVAQIDGEDVIISKKVLAANEGNDYNSILGGAIEVNYTYTLTLQGIRDDGTLRVAISAGNVIDKANNPSEAITLETNVVLDNQGPKLGPITTNADANHQIFGGNVEVKIESCYDENEIMSYEWQRSENRTTWETIKIDETNSSSSNVIDPTPPDGRYFYRVIVTDAVGNSTTSEEVFIDYFTSILSIPIIRLEQESKGVGVVEIAGTITSTLPIEKVTVNGIEIPASKLASKVNVYQITTTFTYKATNNGVYTFVATDTNGNTAQESINVNLVDGTTAIITAKSSDATIFSDAQIVFTANEPVRIINPNGYEGITFNTSDFTTTIVATISKDVDYAETKTFEFENKAILQTDVEVPPPIITKIQYLRFSKIASPMLGITIKRAQILVSKMAESKVLSEGKIVSYYGFGGSAIIDVSTNADLNAAINLGNAGKIQIMDTVGKLKELEKSVEESIKALDNTNYINGNISGVYKKSAGTMEPTESLLEDDETTYNAFRATIRIK